MDLKIAQDINNHHEEIRKSEVNRKKMFDKIYYTFICTFILIFVIGILAFVLFCFETIIAFIRRPSVYLHAFCNLILYLGATFMVVIYTYVEYLLIYKYERPDSNKNEDEELKIVASTKNIIRVLRLMLTILSRKTTSKLEKVALKMSKFIPFSEPTQNSPESFVSCNTTESLSETKITPKLVQAECPTLAVPNCNEFRNIKVPTNSYARIPGPVLIRTTGPALIRFAGPVLIQNPGPSPIRSPEPALIRNPGPLPIRGPEPALLRHPGPALTRTPNTV